MQQLDIPRGAKDIFVYVLFGVPGWPEFKIWVCFLILELPKRVASPWFSLTAIQRNGTWVQTVPLGHPLRPKSKKAYYSLPLFPRMDGQLKLGWLAQKDVFQSPVSLRDHRASWVKFLGEIFRRFETRHRPCLRTLGNGPVLASDRPALSRAPCDAWP